MKQPIHGFKWNWQALLWCCRITHNPLLRKPSIPRVFFDPMDQSHPLDPTTMGPLSILTVPIRLLIKCKKGLKVILPAPPLAATILDCTVVFAWVTELTAAKSVRGTLLMKHKTFSQMKVVTPMKTTLKSGDINWKLNHCTGSLRINRYKISNTLLDTPKL